MTILFIFLTLIGMLYNIYVFAIPYYNVDRIMNLVYLLASSYKQSEDDENEIFNFFIIEVPFTFMINA